MSLLSGVGVAAVCWLAFGAAVPLALPQNGTDQGLYNVNLFEGDILLTQEDGKTAVTKKDKLWPKGALIYRVHDSVGCPTSAQCNLLMAAFDHYHENTCIRFQERTDEEDFVEIFLNPQKSACWSPVGRNGGIQQLSLGEQCWYFGLVVHELGHAIGFWHEMNRPDRDHWIEIIWRNIVSGFSAAFRKQNSSEVTTLGENFDYMSVMMYDELAFSKDGHSKTIIPRMNGVVIGPIWRKPGLSGSDKRRLHRLYQCNGNQSLGGFPTNSQCDFNANTCGFVNTGFSSWSWRNVNATEGFVFSSAESSDYNPGYFTSINYHGLEEGDSRGPLGCIKFEHWLRGSSLLKLSVVYLNRVTQLDIESDMMYDLWDTDEVTNWSPVEVPLYVTRPFKLIFHSYFEDASKDSAVALDNVDVMYTACSQSKTDNTL